MPSPRAHARTVLLFTLVLALFGLATAGTQRIHRHSLQQPTLTHYPRQESSGSSSSSTDSSSSSSSSSSASSSSSSSSITSSSSRTTTTSKTSSSTSTTSISTTSSSSPSSTSASTTSSSQDTTSSTSSTSSDSPSSSSFSSSSTATSSSPTTTGAEFVPSPTTTLGAVTVTSAGAADPPQDTGTEPTPSETPLTSASSNASSGFWDNKGAVAGTFISVAIVILGLGAFMFVRTRRKQFNKRANSQYFEPYNPRKTSMDFGPAMHGDGHPSMTDLSNATPMTAYPNRDIHQDNIVPPEIVPIDYGATQYRSSGIVGYPPVDTSYGVHAQEQDYTQRRHPYSFYDNSQNTSHLQSNNPFDAPTARPRSNNPFLDVNGNAPERGSYQPSLDSFYGADGQRAYSGYAV